ncbi:hypothetical protein [Pandoraea commovens]|uniref:Phage-related membrane protein n=1 Tax=Pandoraea commovens TaxID=2508289 RepID=A0A5E4T4E0_9BURK|nr:hypothetical protein [Pandoraea commovens]VVD82281.1 hypothetical protein PCO31010_01212 [Pandoraea commovens]
MKKALQRLQSISAQASIGVALATASCFANAAGEASGPDLSSLTSGISMGSTSTAILAVALALATVYGTLRGAKIVLSVIKG